MMMQARLRGRLAKSGGLLAMLVLMLALGQSARADLITNGNFAIARISQTCRCIGAKNLRKLFCENDLTASAEFPDADRLYPNSDAHCTR
jgi:hypothetical protein